ncbi:hypothetical protein H072_4833 [Dactylellina haptotyla CBS 200.50]|uniref:PH domain-containing protein n=1 Tax=Dactylellina haptotyla (strain CBS 200.50) TaxID=1284197 RepID=S8AE75_DACHA|nr:hypothetical protein H072_4833 [Dactylellina haptotyla CBS 200.50]
MSTADEQEPRHSLSSQVSVSSSSSHKRSRSAIALSRLSVGGFKSSKSSDKLAPSPTSYKGSHKSTGTSPTSLHAPSASSLLSPNYSATMGKSDSIRSSSSSTKAHKRAQSYAPSSGSTPSLTTSTTLSSNLDSGILSPRSTNTPLQQQQQILPPPPPKPAAATLEESVRTFRLFEALRNGDTAAISKAIRDASEPDSSLDMSSILLLAVQCAEVQVVEFILASTSREQEPSDGKPYLDINHRDANTGNTALHFAAHLGRQPLVTLLLSEPAINDATPNHQGAQAIDLSRTPEIAQELQVSRDAYLDRRLAELHKLILTHNYPELEVFLEVPRTRALLDLNAHDGGVPGSTLLHEAAKVRDIRLIQILLLHGADPFRRDKKGKLPQDVTKDEKTRAVLKRSPAAVAAQNSIQEKAVLGSGAGIPGAEETSRDGTHREGREMKGHLKKWTNYTGGYKLRWFVLENGVLSYYKHQDDMESACRGAINMKIATLYMDPQDKLRFEIHGKSSVKYHLKANHQVEAKRWYWALNNAIQWAKDEARMELQKAERAKVRLTTASSTASTDRLSATESTPDLPSSTASIDRRGSKVYAASARSRFTSAGDLSWEDVSEAKLEASENGRPRRPPSDDDDDDMDDDEFDDAMEENAAKMADPVYNETYQMMAHSTKMQLDMLAQACAAISAESTKSPQTPISDPGIVAAMQSYEGAINNLRNLAGELFKLSREREVYWKSRLDKEVDLRKLWEDNMTKLAVEQEELEGRMNEVMGKQKRTKRALREVLREGAVNSPPTQELQDALSDLASPTIDEAAKSPPLPVAPIAGAGDSVAPSATESAPVAIARKKTIKVANMELSDSDEADASDEEFFDAVDAGEIEIQKEMPTASVTVEIPVIADKTDIEEIVEEAVRKSVECQDETDRRLVAIKKSFRGYEDGPRFKFNKSADDRPKISLWGILKSMVGKDMTKMTLPVSFNECTSLLQRVAEDMEYTDLLDMAAERADSLERLVYVAAFAASEYSSTINRIAKPFNPLLGETYEYCRPDKGFRFFIEQVSHHPPIGAAWAEGPRWEYYGESSVRAKFYGRSFDINPLGTWFLKLHPATGGTELYTWKKVNTAVVGIITGSPTVDNYGPMEIKNWTTGEQCVLDFKARGWRGAGAYEVKGKVVDKDGMQRWSMGGRWNDKLYARMSPGYDVQLGTAGSKDEGISKSFSSTQAFLVWETHERPPAPFNLTPFAISLNYLPDNLKPHLCPTDTRLRPDQRAMEDGEYDFAADEKNRLEEKQRAKRRERENNGEEYKPRWFTKARDETTGEEYWKTNEEYWAVRHKAGNGGTWEGVPDIF